MSVRLTLVMASVLAGCGSDGGGSGPDLPGSPALETRVGGAATATIGAAGGTITSADGRLTLVFPAGALAADTAIEVQELELEGGRAWSLSPDGLMPAMPIQATVTLGEDEAGMPARETVDGDEVETLPVPYFLHLPGDGGPPPDVEVAAAWREADGELDYTLALPHFSVVAYIYAGRQGLGRRASIAVGFEFNVAMRQETPPMTVPLLFQCGEQRRSIPFNVWFTPTSVALGDNERIVATGGSGVLSDESGYASGARCVSVGLDAFSATAPLRPHRVPRDAFDVPGCTLAEPTNHIRRELTVECTDRVCNGSDPVDIGMLPDGDPSVDLVCATTGTLSESVGRHWVRVLVDGPWRPSSSFYSWYTKVTVSGAAGVLGSHTIQHHAGVDEILGEGMVTPSATILTEEANGYELVFPEALVGMITSVAVESGIQKTPTARFTPDNITAFAFDGTIRTP